MEHEEYFHIHSNQKSNSLPREKPMSIESKHDCLEEVNPKIPFCCTVNFPHGFQYVPNETHKIAYNLDCISVVEEKCRKIIQVDGCGPVEVTLNLLKVVGCIPYITNATVEGQCGSNCECNPHGKHSISVCCSGSICVNNVLKCSIECLPHYEIDCHHVVISDFTVKQLQEQGCQMLQFTGIIEFKYIPHG
ncbi:ABC transporter permease [Bacillus cereus]|uniref:ABC transporter permease n=1 Tax=Bacillus cereus TaxID=1396 RepID=A0A9X7A0L6_BACCE|nr:ABC transporter permease [Bacillus cereus]PFK21664.1 ABC transporter permease [Bacillus cereus]